MRSLLLYLFVTFSGSLIGIDKFCFAYLATSCPSEQTKIYQLIFCNFYSEAYFCF